MPCTFRNRVLETVGLLQPLGEALEPLRARIRAAFVYGSIATGTDRADSDVDLLVIADELDHAELFAALQPAEETLARRVNPTVFGIEEWLAKRRGRCWSRPRCCRRSGRREPRCRQPNASPSASLSRW